MNYDRVKTMDILGENRCAEVTDTRYGCRGILVKENKILTSHELNTGWQLIPGGGLEDGETPEECCAREVCEETGYAVKPLECFLIINEYYKSLRYVSYYFICEETGKEARRLTEREAENRLVPEWVNINEFYEAVRAYNNYRGVNDDMCFSYKREAMALREYFGRYEKSDGFKKDIIKFYNTEAEIRDGKSKRVQWKADVRESYLNALKKENSRTLLEIGAGAGYDSLYFSENGLDVTAVDISEEMCTRCRDKGIRALALDYYSLASLGEKFDAVYAMNTLLHVPKEDLPKVLHEISSVLNDGGLFYLGQYGGADTEMIMVISEVSDAERYFSFYSADYLKTALTEFFDIVSFETLPVEENSNKYIFHSGILKKRH